MGQNSDVDTALQHTTGGGSLAGERRAPSRRGSATVDTLR